MLCDCFSLERTGIFVCEDRRFTFGHHLRTESFQHRISLCKAYICLSTSSDDICLQLYKHTGIAMTMTTATVTATAAATTTKQQQQQQQQQNTTKTATTTTTNIKTPQKQLHAVWPSMR